ncbi:MAG: hypothetical protein JSV45_09915 [Chromatiales bacterium]|nr:MAG: hypothetical protein JSV45_09915 [Chromatiales bacterium]
MNTGNLRGTRYWAANLVAALIVLVLLGLHLGMFHLDGLLRQITSAWSRPMTWNRVVERGESGWFTASYVLLLGMALFHGLYGVHTILTERWCSPRASARIATGCWLVGIALFAVGTATVLVFHFGLTGE